MLPDDEQSPKEKKLRDSLVILLSKGLMCLVKIDPESQTAKSISTKLLRSVWDKISDKPFPDVYAYTLEDSEFLSTLTLLQKQERVIDTRVKEYGAKIDNKCLLRLVHLGLRVTLLFLLNKQFLLLRL